MSPKTQQHADHNLTLLADLCPYADICDKQGRELPRKSLASCCLPCSCDSTCRKMGNCCDKRESYDYMCYSPTVKQSETNETVEDGYFMIDKCLDGSERDCITKAVAPWGFLYPVNDPVSDQNFYNPHCAECSGVVDYTTWDVNVICQRFDMNDGFFLNMLRGQSSEGCYIEFTPPKRMIQMNHICSSKLISHCNATGQWKTHIPEMEEACARWYSPVVNMFGVLQFANIYCQLCNGITTDPEDMCAAAQPTKTTTKNGAFAILVDYRRVSIVVDKRFTDNIKPARNGACGKYLLKHVSKPECRTPLCPNGFLRLDDRCLPISSKTLNGGYYVQLLLTPTTDKLLPLSYLKNLSNEQIKEPAKWFEVQGAPLDHFEICVKKADIGKTAYVEGLIVMVGKMKYPFVLGEEIKSIQDAIIKPWAITLNDKVFHFSVKLYRYARFRPLALLERHNILDYLNRVKEEDTRYVETTEEEMYEQMTVRDEFPSQGQSFILKKTNFCNRVRLTRSEWIAGFQEISLNTSKEVFDNNKTLGDSEFDIFLNEQGEPTVEICVEDFNPDYQEQQARATAAKLFSSVLHVFMLGLFM